MKLNKFNLLCAVMMCLAATVSLLAQNKTFSDPNVEYSFEVPGSNWIMTVKPSNINPNVEYVNKDRRDGQLEVRKTTFKTNQTISDIIRDEETKLQFFQGYVAGKEENFDGSLSGRVFNFEYVRSGRAMSGRYYFLKASATDVYILRFTGESAQMLSSRSDMDLIARTFKIKTAK